MDDLVQHDGIYCKKFTDVPFTGEIDEGLERGNFKKGKQEGKWVFFIGNGSTNKFLSSVYRDSKKVSD